MEKFTRTDKQTGDVVVGTWDEVCELDVRVWTRAKLVKDPKPEPFVEITSTCFFKGCLPAVYTSKIRITDVLHVMSRTQIHNRVFGEFLTNG